LSHSWLAPTGATEGGDKNALVNKACGSSVQLALIGRAAAGADNEPFTCWAAY